MKKWNSLNFFLSSPSFFIRTSSLEMTNKLNSKTFFVNQRFILVGNNVFKLFFQRWRARRTHSWVLHRKINLEADWLIWFPVEVNSVNFQWVFLQSYSVPLLHCPQNLAGPCQRCLFSLIKQANPKPPASSTNKSPNRWFLMNDEHVLTAQSKVSRFNLQNSATPNQGPDLDPDPCRVVFSEKRCSGDAIYAKVKWSVHFFFNPIFSRLKQIFRLNLSFFF